MNPYVIHVEGKKVTIVESSNMVKEWLKSIGFLNANIIGGCEISELPGCSSIAIINNFKINSKYENLGFGKILLEQVLFTIVARNYNKVMATVNQNSPKMHTLLKKKGFVENTSFINTKTNNTISLYTL